MIPGTVVGSISEKSVVLVVLHLSSSCQYFLCRPAINMRKNFDGLSGLVQSELKRDSFCGAVAEFVANPGLIWDA